MARARIYAVGAKGRPPIPEGERKSRNLTFRVRPFLYDRLQIAAHRVGRSISDEIEHRLQASFAEEATLEAAFGSRETYELMKAVAATLNAVAGAGEGRLLDDPVRYARAVNAVNGVLHALRPAPTAANFERAGESAPAVQFAEGGGLLDLLDQTARQLRQGSPMQALEQLKQLREHLDDVEKLKRTLAEGRERTPEPKAMARKVHVREGEE